MTKYFITLILLVNLVNFSFGQVILFFPNGLANQVMPEHGFLPGSKFKFYQTIDKYNFSQLKVRIEVFDDRESAKLNKVNCSDLEFTNTSEFAKPECVNLLAKYVDTLFNQAGAIIDSSSKDTIQIHLEGIDSRMIGFVSIRAHGLCQLKINYHNSTKIYCIDITDADKNSPIGPNAFVTRKTATRIIGSAAMRETIEQFFRDVKNSN